MERHASMSQLMTKMALILGEWYCKCYRASPDALPSNIPSTCPFPTCENPIPGKISEALFHLFQRLTRQTRQNGGRGSQLTILEICMQISKEKKKNDPSFLRTAEKNNWPTVIAFALLPDRILQFRGRLHGLITDYNALAKCIHWERLCKTIKNDFSSLSMNEAEMILASAAQAG